MCQREIERTGISSLKIDFNNVLVTTLRLEIHIKTKFQKIGFSKQTLVNAERYITEELKEYETKF